MDLKNLFISNCVELYMCLLMSSFLSVFPVLLIWGLLNLSITQKGMLHISHCEVTLFIFGIMFSFWLIQNCWASSCNPFIVLDTAGMKL